MTKGSAIAVLIAVASLAVSGLALAAASGGTLGVTNFNSVTLSDDLVVGDDVTIADDIGLTAGDLTLTAGDLAVTAGDASFGGEVDLDGTDFLNLSPATTQAVAAGSAVSLAGTFQPLTSTASVALSTTTSIATTGAETGDLLILKNDNASDTITVDGTGGTVECKANVILGAQDTLWLVFNGTNWVCLSTYDNS